MVLDANYFEFFWGGRVHLDKLLRNILGGSVNLDELL